MDRQCPGRTRQVERKEPDSADGGNLEALGPVLAKRVQAGAAAGLRLRRGGCRAFRAQELPAYASDQFNRRLLGSGRRWIASVSILEPADRHEAAGVWARRRSAAGGA